MNIQTSDPSWLSADQLAAWRGLVTLMQRLPADLEAQLQADAQLSFVEYYVLALLSDDPQRRLRMSQLAEKVNCELSRLSHMVSRLDKRGYVRREADPEDGRCTLAVLTEAGLAHLESAAPGHVERVREVFVDALTPAELATLRRLTQKVVDRIDTV